MRRFPRSWSDSPALVRLSRRAAAPGRTPLRVGWVPAAGLRELQPAFASVEAAVGMRISNTARWMNAHAFDVMNEMYRANRRYDVVVFVKAMDQRFQAEADRLQAIGTKVIFDANVNYYEVWGEYDLPNTRPTDEQREQATAMTKLADWVVADSSYLLSIIEKHTTQASWIPDNVDVKVFRAPRVRRSRTVKRLVWSGRASKAKPLLSLADVFADLRDVELVICSDVEPEEARALRDAVPVRFVPFDLHGYARLLRRCDVIVSPKRLVNAYELGHTEWKITLGMACGLPAVASPQQSYREALESGGGIIADTPAEWSAALGQLVSEPETRAKLGREAVRTVRERYATPVVAHTYLDLLRRLT